MLLHIQVIRLDNVPVSLNYIPYLDAVWMLCSAIDDHEGEHTIQVRFIYIHNDIKQNPGQGRNSIASNIMSPGKKVLAERLNLEQIICSYTN